MSIHSLHRISKYVGKEGTAPKVNKLGTQAWNNLKKKTKSKVKQVAFDLLKLYAKRKTTKGFAYTPDTYLQHELEASFIYEDTPDQETATEAIKKDMEAEYPMDRLVCGDVGFGKTELRKSDFGKPDLGKIGFGKTDLGENWFGKTEFGKNDFGKPDFGKKICFGKNEFGKNRSLKRDFGKNILWKSDFGNK